MLAELLCSTCLIFILPLSLRSHPAILKIPNELFYDGELRPSIYSKRSSYESWEGLFRKVTRAQNIFKCLSSLPAGILISFLWVSGFPCDLPWRGRQYAMWPRLHISLQHGRSERIDGLPEKTHRIPSQTKCGQCSTPGNWHHHPIQKTSNYINTITNVDFNTHLNKI